MPSHNPVGSSNVLAMEWLLSENSATKNNSRDIRIFNPLKYEKSRVADNMRI